MYNFGKDRQLKSTTAETMDRDLRRRVASQSKG